MPLSLPKRILLGLALVIPACALVYGIVTAGLFSQPIWNERGLLRFEIYTAAFAVCSTAILAFAPRKYGTIATIVALLAIFGTVGISPVVAVAFFLASAYAFGRMVYREPGVALVTGIALHVFLLSLLVHVPVSYPVTYIVIFGLPLALNRSAIGEIVAAVKSVFDPAHLNSRSRIAAVVALTFVTLAQCAVALKPEISGDGLAMHLAIPASVASHHEWEFDAQHLTYAVMPMGGDWCYTAVYLLGGESAARLLNFAFLLIIATLLYAFVRRWLSPAASMLIAALWIGSPLAQLVTGALFVENSWAVMVTAAFMSLFQSPSYATAILLGTSMSMKFGSIAFVAPAAIASTFLRKGHQQRRTLLAIGVFVVFAAPAYVTAYLKTGNPIFPFANDKFKSPYFDSTTPFRDVRFHQPLSWNTLYDVTIHTSKYFEGQNGAFGFHFLLLLPVALLALFLIRATKRREAASAVAIALVFTVLTFASQANVRYLYPVLPLLLIGIAWVFGALPAVLTRAAIALACLSLVLNIWFLPASSWYHKDFALLNDRERTEYLKEGAPVRRLVEYMNLAHPGEPVLFFGIDQFAGLNGRFWSDTWRHQSFQQRWSSNSDARRELELAHSIGVRYFIAPSPDTGRGAPWIGTRLFLSVCTEPEFKYGSAYVARLKPDFVSGDPNKAFAEYGRRFGAVPPGTYDDTHPAIQYQGTWVTDQQFPETLNQTISYSDHPGNSFTLNFEGTEVTWIYTKAENRGVASVFIDEQNKTVVDLYSPRTEWQTKMTFDKLAPGKHSMTVIILDQKNPASKDRYVDIDALQVGSTQVR